MNTTQQSWKKKIFLYWLINLNYSEYENKICFIKWNRGRFLRETVSSIHETNMICIIVFFD
jgi:hypothetical protein